MKIMLKIGMAVIIMGILGNIFFGGGSDSEGDIPTLIKEGALVIDVRSAGEYSGGHIQGAINIPHPLIAREIPKLTTDKNQSIIVYCFSGARSGAAKQSLETIGYTAVINGGSFRHMRKVTNQ